MTLIFNVSPYTATLSNVFRVMITELTVLKIVLNAEPWKEQKRVLCAQIVVPELVSVVFKQSVILIEPARKQIRYLIISALNIYIMRLRNGRFLVQFAYPVSTCKVLIASVW